MQVRKPKWKISSIPSCNILHKQPHVRVHTNKNKLLVLSYVTQLSPTCIEKSAFFGMFCETDTQTKRTDCATLPEACTLSRLCSVLFCFFVSFFLSNYRHIDLHLPVSPVPLSKTPRSKNELGPDTNRQQP